MRFLILTSTVALTTLTPGLLVNPAPILAQSQSAAKAVSADPFFLTRARNLARDTAIRQNGGLENYRPDPIMFGPAIEAPHQVNSDGSVTFSFKGGPPAFSASTLESVITVSPNGAVAVNYNGPIRSTGSPVLPGPTPQAAPSSASLSSTIGTPLGQGGGTGGPEDDAFLARAQNLARQAAIATNGGLSVYRPEPAMFGPSAQAPFSRNSDGSVTYRFRGGPPASASYTVESVVTVSPSDTVVINANGPIPTAASPVPIQMQTQQPLPSRPATGVPPVPDDATGAYEDVFVTRAQNLARQAAIEANGGLEKYRPEDSMFGPSAQAPFVRNPDGSVTFRFQGGTPGSTTKTVESVVNVTQADAVTVEYNGPVRSQ